MNASVERSRFDEAYARLVLGNAFLETRAYYRQRKERYWNTLRRLEPYLGPGKRVLDIGGGQFALLVRELHGSEPEVVDIDSRYRASLDSAGIAFHHLDLIKDVFFFERPFDLIVMCEVIGHVPVPPHLIFEKLGAVLKSGGRLALTTPNLFRFRNVVRMAMGKPIFTAFVLPSKDRPSGHFTEYDQLHLEWQLQRAGLEVEVSDHVQLDMGGATLPARIGRWLASPLYLVRPMLRDNLFMVGRKPAEPARLAG